MTRPTSDEPGGVADERAWQDAVGGRLQEEAYARAGTRAVLDRQHARIAGWLAPRSGERILDVGCGAGHLLAWLAAHTPAHFDGLDLSPVSLRRARATGARDLVAADATALPLRDGSYDAVVCNGAAHHLPDLAGALREIHRILRPGGRLLLFEPVDSPFAGAVRQTLFRSSRYESPADLAHKSAFTERAVTGALEAAGFRDIVTSAHEFLAYPLSGMYMALPWSRSRRAMSALIAVEERCERSRFLAPLWRALSWRVRFSARRAP